MQLNRSTVDYKEIGKTARREATLQSPKPRVPQGFALESIDLTPAFARLPPPKPKIIGPGTSPYRCPSERARSSRIQTNGTRAVELSLARHYSPTIFDIEFTNLVAATPQIIARLARSRYLRGPLPSRYTNGVARPPPNCHGKRGSAAAQA